MPDSACLGNLSCSGIAVPDVVGALPPASALAIVCTAHAGLATVFTAAAGVEKSLNTLETR